MDHLLFAISMLLNWEIYLFVLVYMLFASPALILKNNNLESEGAYKIQNNFYTFFNYLANSKAGIFIQALASVSLYTSIFALGISSLDQAGFTFFNIIEFVYNAIFETGPLYLGLIGTSLLIFALMKLIILMPSMNTNFLIAFIVLFLIVFPDMLVYEPLLILKGFIPIHWILLIILIYLALMNAMIKLINRFNNKFVDRKNLKNFIKYYFQVTFGLLPLLTYMHSFYLVLMA